MAIHRFNDGSLIDEITVLKNATGGARAYLHARENATDAELAKTIHQLGAEGFMAVPYTNNGKPVLEVRGFKKENNLFDALRMRGAIQGPDTVEKTPQDEISLLERCKKNTLKLSVITYLIGDLSYITYGQMKKEKNHESWEDRMAGVAYMAGTATGGLSLLAGGDQSEVQIKKTSRELLRLIGQEHLRLTEEDGLSLALREKDKTLLGKAGQAFGKHPSEIMNLCFAGAGMLIARGARQELRELESLEGRLDLKNNSLHLKEKRVKKQDMALGAITTLSGIVPTFIPERPRDPEDPRRGGVGGIWDWIREKPLRVAGYGLLLSTLIHANSSWEQIRASQQKGESVVPSVFRSIFVITNIIAELLMAFSSKGHGEGVKADGSIDKSMCAMAAQVIARQSPSYQAGAITRTAEFLSMPEVMGGSTEKIASLLSEQIAGLKANPWAKLAHKKTASDWQARTTQPATPLIPAPSR